jgi:ABC-type sugar transport system permease subunit
MNRKSMSGRARAHLRRHSLAYMFLSPTIALYSLFVLYPFANSLFLSLTKWDGIAAEKTFVGLDNYGSLLTDRVFWNSLSHNIIWMVCSPTISISLGLLTALLLWNRPIGFTAFRTFFFLPQVLGAAVIGVIWKFIYDPRRGIIGQLGDALGMPFLSQGWLADSGTALGAIIAADIWAATGFFMVIFLSGLQGVSTELLEAAKLDGANAAQRLRHVIIPQLAPVITMVSVLGIIGSLNVFDLIWAMTQGGPGNSTEVIGTYIYTKAFEESNIGYGAALTMVMTVLALLSSFMFIKIRGRREQQV